MLDGPSARTCSFLKKALTLNTEPVRRWHSPQWQTPTTSGSADTSTRKVPQEQCAVLVIDPSVIRCSETTGGQASERPLTLDRACGSGQLGTVAEISDRRISRHDASTTIQQQINSLDPRPAFPIFQPDQNLCADLEHGLIHMNRTWNGL